MQIVPGKGAWSYKAGKAQTFALDPEKLGLGGQGRARRRQARLCAVHTGSTYRGNFGFIDAKGNVAIPLQFEWALNFSEGLAAVTNGKFNKGYIDRNGAVVIPLKYNSVGPFEDGFAYVAVGKPWRYGLIDKTGKFAIEPKYEKMSGFKGGYAEVELGKGKYGIIDRTGRGRIFKGIPEWRGVLLGQRGPAPRKSRGRSQGQAVSGHALSESRAEWMPNRGFRISAEVRDRSGLRRPPHRSSASATEPSNRIG